MAAKVAIKAAARICVFIFAPRAPGSLSTPPAASSAKRALNGLCCRDSVKPVVFAVLGGLFMAAGLPGARLSNASRVPGSRASRGTACEFGRFLPAEPAWQERVHISRTRS